jgi:hypothetical protein
VRLIRTDMLGNPEWCRLSLGSGVTSDGSSVPGSFVAFSCGCGSWVHLIRTDMDGNPEWSYRHSLGSRITEAKMTKANSFLSEELPFLSEELRGTQACARAELELVTELNESDSAATRPSE